MKVLYADVDFPQPNAAGADSPEALLEVRRNYAAMVENIDGWLGTYVDVLRERGELDRKLIVFGDPERCWAIDCWGKSLPHQPSIGVPLTVAGPGVQGNDGKRALDHSRSGRHVSRAGKAVLPAMESRSLWPLLTGQAKAALLRFSALEDWRVAFDGRYKLVAWGDASRRAMSDLQTDPSETCDISGSAGFDEIQSALVEHLRSYA